MKHLIITIALLLSVTAAAAHPNHASNPSKSCHSHGSQRHCH